MKRQDIKEELRDLATHQAGATDLHKTRHTQNPVRIDPPKVSPGPVDTRANDGMKQKSPS